MRNEKGARSSSEFCEWAGIGKTTFWAEVKAKRLKIRHVGAKVLVTDEDGRAWLAALPLREIAGTDNGIENREAA